MVGALWVRTVNLTVYFVLNFHKLGAYALGLPKKNIGLVRARKKGTNCIYFTGTYCANCVNTFENLRWFCVCFFSLFRSYACVYMFMSIWLWPLDVFDVAKWSQTKRNGKIFIWLLILCIFDGSLRWPYCALLYARNQYERIWLFNYIYCCLRESIRQSCLYLLSRGAKKSESARRFEFYLDEYSLIRFLCDIFVRLECDFMAYTKTHAVDSCFFSDISGFSSNETRNLCLFANPLMNPIW